MFFERDQLTVEPQTTACSGAALRPASPLVFVLVLNWNNWRDTNECLASLRQLEYDNWQLIVLDNGSSDGSVARIHEGFPEVEIMELGANLGFASGNNAGIRAALERGAEFVWLLNNDTTVHPQALHAMVERAESDSRIGAVGSAVYCALDRQRLLAWGGGYVNFGLGRSRHFRVPVPDGRIQFLTGASLLLRRSALQSAGLLDEGFFLYWEDVDYCWRLRRAGWTLAVAGRSSIWHKESSTVGPRTAKAETEYNKSLVRFLRRNSPVPAAAVFVGTVLRLARRAILRDWDNFRAVWSGVKAGWAFPPSR
jgi:GT2 family glycosyltransferase